MDPQACQDPRESQEAEGTTGCPGSLAFGVTWGSRAWQADLETRGRRGSRAPQDSRACVGREESGERKVTWAFRDRKATEATRAKPAQWARLEHPEPRPCSPRTRECQGSKDQRESRVTVARPGNRGHRAVLETSGLLELRDCRVPRDKKVHRERPAQLETLVLLDL